MKMFKSFFLIWIGVVFSFLNSPIVAHPEDPLKSEPFLSNPYKECIKKKNKLTIIFFPVQISQMNEMVMI